MLFPFKLRYPALWQKEDDDGENKNDEDYWE
jgi:hypothetical protein